MLNTTKLQEIINSNKNKLSGNQVTQNDVVYRMTGLLVDTDSYRKQGFRGEKFDSQSVSSQSVSKLPEDSNLKEVERARRILKLPAEESKKIKIKVPVKPKPMTNTTLVQGNTTNCTIETDFNSGN